jgi:hypothetical protein
MANTHHASITSSAAVDFAYRHGVTAVTARQQMPKAKAREYRDLRASP